jgi:hypothetical protein
MTTSPKRSLQRGVLSLLESAAWSASPWRSLPEIRESVAESSANSRPFEQFRECLEKLARRGLIKVKGERGAELYRAVLSPVWSLAPAGLLPANSAVDRRA